MHYDNKGWSPPKAKCPGCGSEDISLGYIESTLLGGAFDAPDPNHHKQHMKCCSCKNIYIRHWVYDGQHYWITDEERKAVHGEAGCCERSYGRKCSCSDGWLWHSSPGGTFAREANGEWRPGQPMYWQCLSCGKREPDKKYPQYMYIDTKIWLDDIRPPPDNSWVWVKTASEAIRLFEDEEVVEISFDHDLGLNESDGCRVADHIEQQAYHRAAKPPKWHVHSANPVGRDNIERIMRKAQEIWDNP